MKSDGWRDVKKPEVIMMPYGKYMTQAIMAGRKTVSIEPLDVDTKMYFWCIGNKEWLQNDPDVLKEEPEWYAQFVPKSGVRMDMEWVKLLCREGDYICLCEQCAPVYANKEHTKIAGYIYKADEDVDLPNDDGLDIFMSPENVGDWIESYNMPLEAARTFLRVNYVGIYHIQDMTEQDMLDCGIGKVVMGKDYPTVKDAFIDVWDSIAGQRNIDKYSWKANPWVLRFDFEICEKPERIGDKIRRV